MAKAKGTVLLGAVKFLRSRRQEALRTLPEGLHHYLSERISPALWYPEEDVIGLIRAILDLIPEEREAALRGMGEHTARVHREGIYSRLMQTADADASFALWSTMHDSGELHSRPAGEGKVWVELRDYACPSPEMCTIIGAYVAETFRLAGRNVEARKARCRCRGDSLCAWQVDLPA